MTKNRQQTPLVSVFFCQPFLLRFQTTKIDDSSGPSNTATSKNIDDVIHFLVFSFFSFIAPRFLCVLRRVLELVGEGGSPLDAPIDGAESLYGAAAAVPWSRFMRQGQTLSVDAILGVVPDGLTHSHFTALTVKVSYASVSFQRLFVCPPAWLWYVHFFGPCISTAVSRSLSSVPGATPWRERRRSCFFLCLFCDH